MNRPIGTGLKLDFCSDFVLIFPPNICEIGQAVPEISISKATRLVQKELLDWKFKNGKILIRYSELATKGRQKVFQPDSTPKVCWALVNYSGINILVHIMTSIMIA